MVMKEMPGGFAVFGDTQFLPGYSVLLPKKNVSSLNDLSIEERTLFLKDMSILGDAILYVCQPMRINYDILGNTDNFLHAHVFPRYSNEPPERQEKPVWLYSPSYWKDPRYQYELNQQNYDEIRQKITKFLDDFNYS